MLSTQHALLPPPATSDRRTLAPVAQLRRPLLSLLVLLVAAGLLPLTAPPADARDLPLSATAKNAVLQVMTDLRTQSSSTDPRFLRNDVWIDGAPDCFRCFMGPSVLSAARGLDSGATDYLAASAIDTLDKAIADHQHVTGAFIPAATGEGSPGIQTVMFANELAWTYLILGRRLDSAHKQSWAASLTKAADWLIADGDTTYYINGNINLAVAMNMDLTARITGERRFTTAAQTALDFAIAPPQDKFPGFGLQYMKTPELGDGSDGAAYFAESGGATPGFDPAYTMLQTDMASMWYLLTRKASVLRLVNLLYNQLSPRIRTTDWTIDVSGGTRRAAPNTRYGFHGSSVAVLALKGGRSDLQPFVAAQVRASLTEYGNQTRYTSPGISFNYGLSLTAMYMAVTSTSGW